MEKNSISKRRVHNRIFAVMVHTTRYAFKGESRLAADAGISKSAVCRLLNGQSNPSFVLMSLLTRALEQALGKSLDPRELISLDGTYPTASICQLVGCRGCLPAEAFDEEANLRPEFKGVKPGQWSISQAPTSHTSAPRHSRCQKNPQARTAQSIQTGSPGRATPRAQAQERR